MTNFVRSAQERLPTPRTAKLPGLALLIVATALVSKAGAVELFNVARPAALDQPRINVLIRNSADSDPIVGETVNPIDPFETIPTINLQAYFDTGASGVLLSNATMSAWGLTAAQHNGQEVVFEDVGVGGTDFFRVSQPISIGLASFAPGTDLENPVHYTQQINNIRAELGPVPKSPVVDPLEDFISFFQDINVVGMPTMTGKVVVIDPKPTNEVARAIGATGSIADLIDNIDNLFLRSHVYAPGTPFESATAESNPGIPVTSHHIKLSYASFDDFTTVTPGGAPLPSLAHNPFVGPNPLLALTENPPADDTPGVRIEYGGQFAEGSFLLDTGAAVSMISEGIASQLDVRYRAGTPAESPVLEFFDGTMVPDQFLLQIGGIGGTVSVAGFYPDSLLLRTVEGNPADDNDPHHLKFTGGAPVLVLDISLEDSMGNTFTLDGILGMNFMVGGAFLSGTDLLTLTIADYAAGAFDWIVFDEPNGLLGLHLSTDLVGDLNRDGFVGQDDLNIIISAWGESVSAGNSQLGDPSGDGFIGQSDLNAVLGAWGQGTPPSLAGLNAVPEPSAWLLVTSAVAMMLLIRRRFSWS